MTGVALSEDEESLRSESGCFTETDFGGTWVFITNTRVWRTMRPGWFFHWWDGSETYILKIHRKESHIEMKGNPSSRCIVFGPGPMRTLDTGILTVLGSEPCTHTLIILWRLVKRMGPGEGH